MSSIQIPRVLSQRGKTQLEIERENFEKHQATSIQKAVNSVENPVKEKHVRTAIIGTHQEKNGALFWSIITKLPLQGHPIVCWKFSHLLHKVLREGHAQLINDSQRYSGYILDLGKLWGHLQDGYGRLIAAYTKLLVQKLNFHRKYPQIPGSLRLEDEELDKICNHDINQYFELSCDMFDYMDDILSVQQRVFGSLDMSRSNSMTATGQCRLAPLIQCIQDSCQLYDFTVKILFRLHSSLPPDTLSGHRDRFYAQYKSLKQFYYSAGNLQYFKNIIRVPQLPDTPPNFLIASELSSHVRPEAIVPDQDPDSGTPDAEDLLIDTSSNTSEELVRFDEPVTQNGAEAAQVPDERDSLIEQLMRQVNELKYELQRVQAEDQMMIESLNNRVRELETEVSELRQIAESTQQENETLKNILKESENNTEANQKLLEAERKNRGIEERFNKMRGMYTKLRDEHVGLLRKNADAEKKCKEEKRTNEEMEQKLRALNEQYTEMQLAKNRLEEMNQQLSVMQHDKSQVEDNLVQTEATSSAELNAARAACQAAEEQNQTLEKQMTDVESARAALEEKLQTVRTHLTGQLDELHKKTKDQDMALQQSRAESTTQVTALTASCEAVEAAKKDLTTRLADVEKTRTTLEQDLETTRGEVASLKGALTNAENSCKQTETTLRKDMEDARVRLLVNTVEECEEIIKDSLSQFDNPHHATVTCTAEYLLSRTQGVNNAIRQLEGSYSEYTKDKDSVGVTVKAVLEFSHRLAEIIINGKATANTASIEAGEALATTSKSTGEESLALLGLIKQGSEDVNRQSSRVCELLTKLSSQAEDLVPKMEDVKAEQMGDLIEDEMEQTTRAIEAAASRIAAMLAESREAHSGIQLEVNERVLDSCTGLMKSIKILIETAKSLQREIVSQGRGASSSKEFYKRHHRWTEGLISAAKAVGWGANVLVEAADKVVKGEGKFEELMVCSQEIAASTAQLVVSSKVKGERGSENLRHLSEASKSVTEATGQVVASAKSGMQMIEDLDTLDFSKLTLHQAKRLEMNSQVRLLELESDLEKERVKLGELRKKHYQLAGESEGWDQETLMEMAASMDGWEDLMAELAQMQKAKADLDPDPNRDLDPFEGDLCKPEETADLPKDTKESNA